MRLAARASTEVAVNMSSVHEVAKRTISPGVCARMKSAAFTAAWAYRGLSRACAA